MKVTTKALRTHTREIMECLERGESVIVTYRGKAKAKLVSVEKRQNKQGANEFPVFGMWADREDMTDVVGYVRELRKGPFHAD